MATILVLEDELPLREAYRELLEGEGFDVLAAEDLLAVVTIQPDRQVDVLLADIGAGGVAAAKALLPTRPKLGILLTSGSHDEPDHGLGPSVRFLRKPTKFSALVDVVREVLESR